jgi:hypothetical protein
MFFNAVWNVFGGFAGSLEAGSFMMVCSEAEYSPFRARETRFGEVKASQWEFLTRRRLLGHHRLHRTRVEIREMPVRVSQTVAARCGVVVVDTAAALPSDLRLIILVTSSCFPIGRPATAQPVGCVCKPGSRIPFHETTIDG